VLWKLCDAGVSVQMVRWIQAWLANRQYWVNVGETRSQTRLFQQGLPQGSVLSPLLFLVFVNDLVEKVSDVVEVSAFADDLATWWSDRNGNVCAERLQRAADMVMRWCDEWLLCLVPGKCSVTAVAGHYRLVIALAGRLPQIAARVFIVPTDFRRSASGYSSMGTNRSASIIRSAVDSPNSAG